MPTRLEAVLTANQDGCLHDVAARFQRASDGGFQPPVGRGSQGVPRREARSENSVSKISCNGFRNGYAGPVCWITCPFEAWKIFK